MPTYNPMQTDEPVIKRIDFPSTPGAEVWGPGKLDWGLKRDIGMLSAQSRQDARGKQLIGGTMASFLAAVVEEWICHPRSDWNLFDANGKKLKRAPATIDHDLDPDDVDHIAQELVDALYPGMFALIEDESEDDEPEGVTDEESPADEPEGETLAPVTPEPTSNDSEKPSSRTTPSKTRRTSGKTRSSTT